MELKIVTHIEGVGRDLGKLCFFVSLFVISWLEEKRPAKAVHCVW